jgi:hypothetical protein
MGGGGEADGAGADDGDRQLAGGHGHAPDRIEEFRWIRPYQFLSIC